MTIAILALLTLLEGIRRVPRESLLLRRVLFGAWRARPAPQALAPNSLQLLSWWSPVVSTIMVRPPAEAAAKPKAWKIDAVRTRLEEHRLTLLDLRVLGLAALVGLVVGMPLAIDRLGTQGFVFALGLLGIICFFVFERMYAAACTLGKTRKAAFSWAIGSFSPFAAPRAAEVLLEELLRDIPPGLVARVLLPFAEFLDWVRPYAYDSSQDAQADARFLAGLDPAELKQSLAAPPDAAVAIGGQLWCPRCGATYLQADACAECGVALLPLRKLASALVAICLSLSSLAAQEPPLADLDARTTAPVTLHAKPDITARALVRLPAETVVRVLGCGIDWCQVGVQRRVGYVQRGMLVAPPVGTLAEAPELPAESPNQVYIEALVDERPEVLSGPPVIYPDLLRQAGVEGRVLVQAVLDTNGRAEPRSIRIIQSPNAGFDQSARDFVLGARFRPARIKGRGVRVLVNLPIDFKIRRSKG